MFSTAPECAWFAGSPVEGVMASVAKKETQFQEEAVADFVSREWWIPDLSEDLQSAIAAAVSAIERSVEEPVAMYPVWRSTPRTGPDIRLAVVIWTRNPFVCGTLDGGPRDP